MKYLAFVPALLLASPAVADISLGIPLPPDADISTQVYQCGSEAPFSVRYVNAGPNSLALLPIDGQERIFVNVVSGSGARYASGEHVWWSKGDSATLENELAEGSLKECSAVE